LTRQDKTSLSYLARHCCQCNLTPTGPDRRRPGRPARSAKLVVSWPATRRRPGDRNPVRPDRRRWKSVSKRYKRSRTADRRRPGQPARCGRLRPARPRRPAGGEGCCELAGDPAATRRQEPGAARPAAARATGPLRPDRSDPPAAKVVVSWPATRRRPGDRNPARPDRRRPGHPARCARL